MFAYAPLIQFAAPGRDWFGADVEALLDLQADRSAAAREAPR